MPRAGPSWPGHRRRSRNRRHPCRPPRRRDRGRRWPATRERTGRTAPAGPTARSAPDAELRSILRAIDPRRIEATVRRLASFGTRHTLSSQDDPVRGIGAARDWLFDTMTSSPRRQAAG